MKNFLKYLGPILVLVGVAILAVYHFGSSQSNTYLVVGGLLMIIGAIGHVIINRKID